MDTIFLFFFFNDTATTEIYTLSLHDALPIYIRGRQVSLEGLDQPGVQLLCVFEMTQGVALFKGVAKDGDPLLQLGAGDRKSTRLNSSHANISYAVFCLKKKKKSKYHISF